MTRHLDNPQAFEMTHGESERDEMYSTKERCGCSDVTRELESIERSEDTFLAGTSSGSYTSAAVFWEAVVLIAHKSILGLGEFIAPHSNVHTRHLVVLGGPIDPCAGYQRRRGFYFVRNALSVLEKGGK
jgi:hypothetical protein